MWEKLPETMADLDDPIGDPLTVPNLLLGRLAKDSGNVILNGEGDPCFGGPKNQPMLLSELYQDEQAPALQQRFLQAYLKSFHKGIANKYITSHCGPGRRWPKGTAMSWPKIPQDLVGRSGHDWVYSSLRHMILYDQIEPRDWLQQQEALAQLIALRGFLQNQGHCAQSYLFMRAG